MSNICIIKCSVPDCDSNSENDPSKIFVKLPKGTELQKKWAETVGSTENHENHSVFHETSELFCCEDHLNLPKDIVNWADIQNKVSRIKPKENIPSCKRKLSSESAAPFKRKFSGASNSNSVCQQEVPSEVNDIVEIQTKKYKKHCFVPNCKSNSYDNPEKMFIRLPNGVEVRKKLAEAFGRKGKRAILHESSAVFCCSDHLVLRKEMQKWITFCDKTTGVEMRIKKQSLPHMFSSELQYSDSSTDKLNDDVLILNTESESQNASKLRKLLMCSKIADTEVVGIQEEEEPESQDDIPSPAIEKMEEVLIKTDPHLLEEIDLEPESEEETSNKINPSLEVEDDEVEVLEEIKNFQEESEIENSQEETEIHENELVVLQDDIPEHQELRSFLLSQLNREKSLIIEEPTHFDRDIQCNLRPPKPRFRSKFTIIDTKYLPENINLSLHEERSSQFLKSLHKTQTSSKKTDKSEEDTLLNASNNLELTRKLVQSFPFRYTGLPAEAFKDFITNIQQGTKLPYNHILLVLLKIRENQSLERLGDAFGISEEEALKIFLKSVPTIASYLKKKVVWPEINTKSQIPPPLKRFFGNIKLIIDRLEVEVEKPKVPLAAEVLRSLEKNCYTVRYLISYTPVGLINCTSQGYGGSRTDDFLIQTSGFLAQLDFPKDFVVLTDTNFCQTEELFNQKNCKLVRLEEAEDRVQSLNGSMQMKRLQEYVGSVMKRLREFRYISSHASLNHDLTSALDFVVIIASAIVNAQGSVPIETEKDVTVEIIDV